MPTTTKTKTPAAIAAETAAAQQSAYDPAFPLDRIHVHPRNPRHQAVADQELIDSIRGIGLTHDLVLAPHPTIEGDGILIDGHRRFHGLTVAGFSYAPVKFRLDLVNEADQLAAMLSTIRREDLTPVEEAEGFDLLAELGMSLDEIAAKTGRSKSTVSERRRLTKLPDKAKAAVATRDLSIDDALTLARFPVADQRRLEQYLHHADFKLMVRRTEERIKAEAAVKEEVKRLKSLGAVELEQPRDANYIHSLTHSLHAMVRLSVTGLPNASDHLQDPKCLGFVVARPHTVDSAPTIWEVCTNPAKHDDHLAELQAQRHAASQATTGTSTAATDSEVTERLRAERDQRQAEAEQRRAEWEERRRAENTARLLRGDDLLAAIRSPKIDPILEALLRISLPEILFQTDGNGLLAHATVFQDLAGVPEDQRWPGGGLMWDNAWLSNIRDLTTAQLLKVLAAFLVTSIEGQLTTAESDVTIANTDPADAAVAMAYFDLLATAGHEENSVDTALLSTIVSGPAPAEGSEASA